MPNDIKTDAGLLARLSKARGIDHETLIRQRISFIYGALPPDSTITREQIAEAVRKIEGEQAA